MYLTSLINKKLSGFLLLACLYLVSNLTVAEPYLAVRTGQKCLACHTNPTGGGKRTEYGHLYAQNSLSARTLTEAGKTWNGRVNDFFGVGGDIRTNLNSTKTPNQNTNTEFTLEEAAVYLEFNVIPEHLTLYIDEKVAPGGAVNQEAWALLKTSNNLAYLKAGRFYLPYGLRLQDDGAFTREVTGINFNNSDDGVEFGFEPDSWSTTLAITNGTNGGAENNQQKQYSLRAEYIDTAWRLGASYNLNDGDNNDDRELAGIFGGTHLLGIDWLFQVDKIENQGATSGQNQTIYYLEANLGVIQGHNFKLSLEQFDPDTNIDEDQQSRTSLVWEYMPFEFTQIRTGYRQYDGIPQDDIQNREQFFIQLHNYF